MPGIGRGDEPMDLEDDGPVEAEEQLDLADGDERLPWLESDDDDEHPGVDTGRLVAFAAVGLLAVALVLGALWFLTRDTSDEELIADGSTIQAPDEPYRTRPADPGGREVAGTGDTSFEVAEGETVEGQIAGESPTPTPTDAPEPDVAPVATASPTATSTSDSVGVQVGAYFSRAAAEAGWATLSGRIEALQGRSHRIIQGIADSGTVYRLQAIAGTVAEADALCRSIRSEGGDCQVKR